MDSYRVEKLYERTVIRIPDNAYHLDENSQHADTDKRWLGIDWPNGNLTVHLLNDEESERWLEGEDIKRDA